jgi:uncharacterized RDD family membrane protein YckC
MIWYYVNDGESVGPISDDQLLSLLQSGAIASTTLVWKTGMPEWQPASAVAPTITPAPIPEPAMSPALGIPIAPAREPATGAPPVLPGFFCTVCGTIIPADQLVRIGGRPVCAACKPLYVQQTQEGVFAPIRAPVMGGRTAPGMSAGDLADPFIRFVAHLLDLVFVGAPLMAGYIVVFFFTIVGFGTAMPNSREPSSAAMMIVMAAFAVVALAWVVFYWTWFIARTGATPAMRLMNLRMVRSDRSPIEYPRALGRFILFYVLNQCTMGLTNLTAFFDRERRTFVDMICDTRVVRT